MMLDIDKIFLKRKQELAEAALRSLPATVRASRIPKVS